MMKYFIIFFMLFSMLNIHAQKDSLQVGDKYWEDQLYINVTYNVLNNQPTIINRSGFSYGFSGGYIKDIPLKKNGKIAVGLGLGYSFDSFNHNLKVVEGTLNSFEHGSDIASNKIKLNNLEMPIQFRWRSSTVNTYSFWRFYAGVKLSYNLSNTFSYTDNNTPISINNITEYNNWQTGLIMSAGYGTFNFHVYYGLSPIFKNASINGNPIDTKILRFGLSFYLL